MMNPINDYPAYSEVNNFVYGISDTIVTKIILEDDVGTIFNFNEFFILNGIIYYNISYYNIDEELITVYYSQDQGVVSEILESEYPVKPISERIQLSESPWEIFDSLYTTIDISSVRQFITENSIPMKNFLIVDAYYISESGLWFSVPDGVPGAEAGLWFFTLGEKYVRRRLDYGRIWK